MAAVWCGVFLILTLCWGPSAVEAHPGMRGAIDPAVRLDAGPGDLPPGPSTPLARDLAPVAAPSSAWTWLILLSFSGIAVASRRRWPCGLAIPLVLLVGVSACETAIHSAHHLKDPRQAERCPIYSASQHVTGLSAAPATPDLPPLLPTLDPPVVRIVQLRSQVLDGKQSRAPPAVPA
jgi:hypothetical protein